MEEMNLFSSGDDTFVRMEIKVKSYTEHVLSSGLSAVVQLRNTLTHQMADRKIRSGKIKWWPILDPLIAPERDGN